MKLFCTPNRDTTYSCGAALSHTVQQDHDRPQGEENYHPSYWHKCLGTLARPDWTYFVALDLHGSSLYSLSVPNLGLRYTNIPAQQPMLVLQRPRHTSEPRRSNDNPGGAILTPRLQAKICSDCHGLTIETCLTIEHVYQCAAFQSLVACASGWEAMAQWDNRCSCKKNERIFLCQTTSSNWVLGVFWVYYKMDILKLIMQSDFWFFKLLRGPRSLFLVYKLGLKKWLKRAFENHFDEKNKINLF